MKLLMTERELALVLRKTIIRACALTDVIFVVDDGVEGGLLAFKVPLRRLHIVGSLVCFNEALEAAINHRAMGQCALFT